MKKKTIALGVASASILATVAAVTLPVMANDWGQGKGQGQGRGQEQKAEMIEVIENGDYDGWLEIMGDRPAADKITEDNFARFAEMAQLFHDGDVEAANEIREELGMPARGLHRGKMMGRRGGRMNGEGRRFQDVNGDGYCDFSDRSEE
ncbi:MAG: hypothetical protein U9Q03_06340 [Patescibacteria group bacterium]|nr:hypothetical protein [Patescibacteria group bacterium]